MTTQGDDRDDRERDEPARRSWREIDRMRDGAREQSEGPRGAAAEARARRASQAYRKQIDGLFSKTAGGDTQPLADALRSAHGTPQLAAACRAYVDAHGAPRDASLATLMLDSAQPELVLRGLEGLTAAAEAGELRVAGGLRSQLALLAEDPDDDIAYAAEELLRR